MDRSFHQWARGFWAVTSAAALGSLFCLESAPAAADSSLPAMTVALEYSEMDQSPAFWAVPITVRATPFKKEPAAVSGKIIRGILHLGGGASNSIPFLWQRDAGKLFLDLNRNEDLTDDPAGVFSLAAPVQGSRGFRNEVFQKIHLIFNTKCDQWTGPCSVLVDVNLWDFGQQPVCNVGIRSAWMGKLTLQGKDWQVGIVPNGPSPESWFEGSSLLLRPWENRTQPFALNNGALDAIPFSPNLFLDGCAYATALVDSAAKGPLQPTLRFAPQSVPLGELRITGKFIRRLVLPGGQSLVVLDQPSEIVQVPVGRYRAPQVQLAGKGAEAVRNANFPETERGITVTEKSAAMMADGGPLTNMVIVNREGQDLRFDYRLVGANEQPYKLVGPMRQPEWSVFRGGKRIASGRFEFG
jgi:hypothetical protein